MQLSWEIPHHACNLQPAINLDLVTQACNPSTWRAEAGAEKFKAMLRYTVSLNQPMLHEILCLTVCLSSVCHRI